MPVRCAMRPRRSASTGVRQVERTSVGTVSPGSANTVDTSGTIAFNGGTGRCQGTLSRCRGRSGASDLFAGQIAVGDVYADGDGRSARSAIHCRFRNNYDDFAAFRRPYSVARMRRCETTRPRPGPRCGPWGPTDDVSVESDGVARRTPDGEPLVD